MAEKVYVGKGRIKTFQNGGSVINFGINVNLLPEPNGKGYVNLTITEMRSPDQWGNTHTVYLDDYQRTESAPANSPAPQDTAPDNDQQAAGSRDGFPF